MVVQIQNMHIYLYQKFVMEKKGRKLREAIVSGVEVRKKVKKLCLLPKKKKKKIILPIAGEKN